MSEPLFVTLKQQIDDEEYDGALKTIKKILSQSPNDVDALASRVFVHIELGMYDEALKDCVDGTFEQAYCLYRLQRLEDAMEVTNKLGDIPETQQLRAQILYRQERFTECASIYATLSDGDDTELAVNLRAARVMEAASNVNQGGNQVDLSDDGTWEFYFNGACYAIAIREYDQALDLLSESEKRCADDEDIAPVFTQRAYCLQSLGRNSEAAELYAKVMNMKPRDIAVMAVANNNTVALRGDHEDLFDSIKKLKAADTTAAKLKLTKNQRRQIGFNHALLHMQMNKVDEAKKLLTVLEQEYPDASALIAAALAYHEKRDEEVESLLVRHKSTASLMALAQTRVNRRQMKQAAETLLEIEAVAHQPGVVATVVSLYRAAGEVELAVDVLKNAVHHWSEGDDDNTRSTHLLLLREYGGLLMSLKRYNEASEAYRAAYVIDRSDVPTLAKLVSCYSYCNLEEAEAYAEQLPALPVQIEDVDIEELEMLPARRDQTEKVIPQVEVQKKKRKKKKKIRLPKDYDPRVAPDPERWLPLVERSYYKKKHGRRAKQNKAQGATAAIGEGARDRDRKQAQHTTAQSSAGMAAIATQKPKGKRGKKRR